MFNQCLCVCVQPVSGGCLGRLKTSSADPALTTSLNLPVLDMVVYCKGDTVKRDIKKLDGHNERWILFTKEFLNINHPPPPANEKWGENGKTKMEFFFEQN